MKLFMNLCGIVFVLNLGFFVVPALADDQADLAQAQAVYAQKDYAKAFVAYKVLAEKGNAAAQYELAEMYDKGLSLTPDHVEALKWYKLAATQQFVKAQYALGYLYHDQAQGVYDEALVWYKKAAEQGDTRAFFEIAMIYEDIKGDVVEAIKWYQLAMTKNKGRDSIAAFKLANIYYEGRGVVQDYVAARKWYQIAASTGSNPKAELMLGVMYHYGQGTKPNHVKALKYYKSAAIQADDWIARASAKNRLKELALKGIR